jgi:hypothetical protein
MRSAPAANALATLLLAACAACDEGAAPGAPAPEPRAWPAGTVLAVEDLPISAAEVDAASVWIERIDRKASPDHLRRLALTNLVLPAKVARLLAPQEYARAQDEARAALESLREGRWVGPVGPDGTLGELRAGTFQLVGIPAWGAALDLAEGEWSEPVEATGQLLLVRRLGLTPAPVPLAIEVEVDVLAFPYLDPATAPTQVEAAYDRFRLTLVDPDWRKLVPELLQYRMGVHGP